MARLKLYLLGRFQAILDESPLTGLRSGKSRALLAYLAGEAGRPHQRSTLATLLWGEHPDEAARLSLRVALSSLRNALAPLVPGQDSLPFLEITHQSVQLNLSPELCWVDVVQFDALLAACEAHQHPSIIRCPACIQRLTEAIALYGGDFLADLLPSDSLAFEEWRLLCQENYHRKAVVALEQIVRHHLALGDYAGAQHYARQLLALEPWHERAHRHLMKAMALDGQRDAALAHYEVCRQTLERELGAAPDAETVALRAEIRDGIFEDRSGATLPAPVTPLVDRVAELARIATMLADPSCRMLTLVGPSGIGKTRLALAAAVQQDGLHRDGVHFVPVSGATTPEALDRALAEALHLTSIPAGTGRRSQLLNHLRAKQLLLVLDDVRPLPVAADWAIELLQRAPGLKILATTQQRLNIRGECLLRIEGLSFPASPSDSCIGNAEPDACCGAIDLFTQAASRVQPGFAVTAAELPHVVRICQLVEGMPLAIELAAAWTPTLPCAEIAAEIASNLDFLTSSLQDLPERHRSLRAVFGQSLALLSPAEQAALCRLSVFRRSFDRAGAGAVAGATLSVLASLTEKALLHREPCPAIRYGDRATCAEPLREAGVCYSLHGLIRQYAAERLTGLPGEPAVTQERHARFCLALLTQRRGSLISADQPCALAELAQWGDDIRAAWDWAVDHGLWPDLERALPSLFLLCYMRSWFQEGEAAFGRLAGALALHVDAQTQSLFGLALAGQAWFAFLMGQTGQAQALFAQAVSHLCAAGDAGSLAFGLVYRGAMALLQGDVTAARADGAESLALYEATGDRYGIAVACNILGRAAHQMGDYEEARRQCQRNLDIARELSNRWSMAFSLELLGRIAMAQKDIPSASDLFLECLAIRRELGDRRGVGLTLSLLADVHITQGAVAEAEACYHEALGVFQALGHRPGSETAQAGLARLATLKGASS